MSEKNFFAVTFKALSRLFHSCRGEPFWSPTRESRVNYQPSHKHEGSPQKWPGHDSNQHKGA